MFFVNGEIYIKIQKKKINFTSHIEVLVMVDMCWPPFQLSQKEKKHTYLSAFGFILSFSLWEIYFRASVGNIL